MIAGVDIDPREDDMAGLSGDHAWNDRITFQPSGSSRYKKKTTSEGSRKHTISAN